MKSFRDLTNTRIHNFTVLYRVDKPLGVKRNESWWKCVCDCGKSFSCSSNSVLHCGKTSCGCVSRYKKDKHHAWKGFEEISSTFWTRIIAKAKLRGFNFNITPQYAWGLFIKQNRVCALSGIDLFFSPARNYIGNASLDRIDSKLGYEVGNIQWVDKRINGMKMAMMDKDLIELCGKIYNYQSDKNVDFIEPSKGITNTFWSKVIAGAKARNLSFNITREYAWSLFIKQVGCCALSGEPLRFNSKTHLTDGNASFDRIDSKIGYEIGNVQWVSKRVNIMKMDLPEVVFTSLCGKIFQHRGNPNVLV